MNERRCGFVSIEAIVACVIVLIVSSAAAATWFTSNALIAVTNDNLCMERAVENLTARLSSGEEVSSYAENGCEIELLEVDGGLAKYRVSRQGFRRALTSYVLWPEPR